MQGREFVGLSMITIPLFVVIWPAIKRFGEKYADLVGKISIAITLAICLAACSSKNDGIAKKIESLELERDSAIAELEEVKVQLVRKEVLVEKLKNQPERIRTVEKIVEVPGALVPECLELREKLELCTRYTIELEGLNALEKTKSSSQEKIIALDDGIQTNFKTINTNYFPKQKRKSWVLPAAFVPAAVGIMGGKKSGFIGLGVAVAIVIIGGGI